MRQFLVQCQPLFQGITLLAGIYMLLVSFGVLRASKDPEVDARWRRERAPLLRVAAIVMVVASLVGLLLTLAPPAWLG
ncbi:MAG: hypothetical protein WKG00_10380 [Polyangiaceae bacterium]